MLPWPRPWPPWGRRWPPPTTPAYWTRLCLESEVEALAAEHAGERILPVPYGTSHDQLAGFLRALASKPEPPRLSSAPATPARLPARRSTLGRDEQVAQAVAGVLGDPP